MPVHVAQNMSFLTYCALFLIPDWGTVLNLPVAGADREAARSGDAQPG